MWPGEAVRAALSAWQTQQLGDGVRPTHRADLHLTLHFLGNVAPDGIGGLRRLGQQAVCAGFVMRLDRLGHWPRPQVLWVAPTEVPAPLDRLHGELAAGLQALGFATEARRWRPHVTLARGVPQRPDRPAWTPVSWTVDEMALVASGDGAAPRYRTVARWRLG